MLPPGLRCWQHERFPAPGAPSRALRPWWEELDASPEEIALARIAIERARDSESDPSSMLAPGRRHELSLAFDRGLAPPPLTAND